MRRARATPAAWPRAAPAWLLLPKGDARPPERRLTWRRRRGRSRPRNGALGAGDRYGEADREGKAVPAASPSPSGGVWRERLAEITQPAPPRALLKGMGLKRHGKIPTPRSLDHARRRWDRWLSAAWSRQRVRSTCTGTRLPAHGLARPRPTEGARSRVAIRGAAAYHRQAAAPQNPSGRTRAAAIRAAVGD